MNRHDHAYSKNNSFLLFPLTKKSSTEIAEANFILIRIPRSLTKLITIDIVELSRAMFTEGLQGGHTRKRERDFILIHLPVVLDTKRCKCVCITTQCNKSGANALNFSGVEICNNGLYIEDEDWVV